MAGSSGVTSGAMFTACSYMEFILLVSIAGLAMWDLACRRAHAESDRDALRPDALLGANTAKIVHDIRNLIACQGVIARVFHNNTALQKEDRELAKSIIEQCACTQDYLKILLGAPDEPIPISLLATAKKVLTLYGRGYSAIYQLQPGAVTQCSPAKLERLLGNLVSNAVEHGCGNYLRINGDSEWLTVENRVTSPLHEDALDANQTTRKDGSGGFGLSIAHTLAKQLGGHLSFDHVKHDDGLWVRFRVNFAPCPSS